MTRIELTIAGMTCDHCVRSVGDALRRVPGVMSADVRIGSATVSLDESRASTADLMRAVKAAGYTVSGFKKAPQSAATG